MKTQEVREGAAGLPNRARINNIKRYALGRTVYNLRRALKGDALNDSLRAELKEAQKAYDACPLDFGGDNASALGVKGRKAASKARDSAAEGA